MPANARKAADQFGNMTNVSVILVKAFATSNKFHMCDDSNVIAPQFTSKASKFYEFKVVGKCSLSIGTADKTASKTYTADELITFLGRSNNSPEGRLLLKTKTLGVYYLRTSASSETSSSQLLAPKDRMNKEFRNMLTGKHGEFTLVVACDPESYDLAIGGTGDQATQATGVAKSSLSSDVTMTSDVSDELEVVRKELAEMTLKYGQAESALKKANTTNKVLEKVMEDKIDELCSDFNAVCKEFDAVYKQNEQYKGTIEDLENQLKQAKDVKQYKKLEAEFKEYKRNHDGEIKAKAKSTKNAWNKFHAKQAQLNQVCTEKKVLEEEKKIMEETLELQIEIQAGRIRDLKDAKFGTRQNGSGKDGASGEGAKKDEKKDNTRETRKEQAKTAESASDGDAKEDDAQQIKLAFRAKRTDTMDDDASMHG